MLQLIEGINRESGSDPHAVIDDMFSNGGGFSGAQSGIMQIIFSGANFVVGKILSFGKFAGLLSPGGYDPMKDDDVRRKLT